ncbi:MAG: hypothetical protein H7Y00_14390 [Fimbriimonadaceae bacterium]|nr:hypothetical protein [Chitinophagales bacterium]
MMKGKLFLCFLLLVVSGRMLSCNTCGCSLSGNTLGINAQYLQNFIGITYYRQFFKQTDGLDLNINSESIYSEIALRGGYKIYPWWQITAIVPYKINSFSSAENGSDKKINGAGDISLVNSFVVLNTADSLMKNYRHQLTLQTGVELPTGKFASAYLSEDFPVSLSAGSGSYDISAGFIYTLQYKTWSLQTQGNYILNTKNKEQYAFGDRMQTSVLASKSISAKKFAVAPFAGMEYNKIFADTKYTFEQEGTAANILQAKCGAEIYYNDLVLGASGAFPVKAHFDEHVVSAGMLFGAYLNYKF